MFFFSFLTLLWEEYKKANKNAKCDVNMFSAGQKTTQHASSLTVLSGEFIFPTMKSSLSHCDILRSENPIRVLNNFHRAPLFTTTVP